jgi:hypothetical protein
MSSSSFVTVQVPVFDGSNYLVWENQMRAWLMQAQLWRITNGQSTRPAANTNGEQDRWDDRDEAAHGAILLRLAHNMRPATLSTNVAALWTHITTTWARTGVSAVIQDFVSACRIKVSTTNPARDITRMQTHLQRLAGNNVALQTKCKEER